MTDKNAAAMGRKRWKGISKEDRAEAMRRVAHKRWGATPQSDRAKAALKGWETRKLRKLGQS